ncbi:MAG: response regulator [Saprospiraceae bacterium]|jgi:DNA-binding NtrC family response regulator|nr:response regulator [Saprospiraceae bacterium]
MKDSSQTVFIVDDDPFHIELMTHILKKEKIPYVMSFSSGVDCLDHIDLNPDIIFLDYQMDVYSGYETLRKIKRYDPNSFVVMVSAQEDIDTAVETLKHGAFDYIKKNENLEEKVQSVLKKISELKNIMNEEKPSFLKSIFKFF